MKKKKTKKKNRPICKQVIYYVVEDEEGLWLSDSVDEKDTVISKHKKLEDAEWAIYREGYLRGEK